MIKGRQSSTIRKKWSKVKVTNQGHRGQITIKMTDFKLLPHSLKKLLADFDELWQDAVSYTHLTLPTILRV